MSFDPKRMVCVTCNDNHVILPEGGGVDLSALCWLIRTSVRMSRRTGVRNACWSSGPKTACCRTWRVSSRMFSGTTAGRGGVLPAGSVILIGSASHVSLLGLATYAEDYVRVNNNIIAACGNGVTVCPLVMVPLSSIKNTRTIEQLADLDSWIMSANLPRNIGLHDSRNALWEVLCTSASDYLEKGPASAVHYLPLSLTKLAQAQICSRGASGEFPR